MKRLFVLFGLLAAFALPVGAAELPTASPEAVGMKADKLADMAAYYQGLVDEGKLAGLTTLVSRHGKVVHFKTYGQQNIEAGTPMAEDTVFRIYSMTKPITGVALMTLYDQGKFSLDDPVAKYLPEFADMTVFTGEGEDGTMLAEPAKRPMTIRDLMRHTAGFTYGGFSDTPVDREYRKINMMDMNVPLAEMAPKLAKVPLLYQPGEKWVYSIGVDVQGYLVEKLSGMPFDQYLQKHIFGPLGMTSTSFAAGGELTPRFTEIYGYDKETGALSPFRDGAFYWDMTVMPKMFSGGAGLVSTTADYWRFAQMMLNGGELDGVRILKEDTVKLMRTNQLPDGMEIAFEKGTGFGLDFAVVMNPDEVGNGARKGEYYWGGLANTVFWIDPEDDVIAILMTNIMPPGMLPFRQDLRRMVYDAVAE